jgi:hypothetical protein
MIKLCASAALAFSLLLFADTAAAFLDPPYLTPEHPTAGDTVSINIRAGVCDGIGSGHGYPRISQEGSHVRIIVWSVSYHDSELCFLPIWTNTIAVGAYPAGSYTLQVDRDYFDGGAIFAPKASAPSRLPLREVAWCRNPLQRPHWTLTGSPCCSSGSSESCGGSVGSACRIG